METDEGLGESSERGVGANRGEEVEGLQGGPEEAVGVDGAIDAVAEHVGREVVRRVCWWA